VLSGLLVGAAVGYLLWLFSLGADGLPAWSPTVVAAALGAVLGAVVALFGYAVTGGRRSFAPDQAVRAGRYEVVVDADLADQAARMLNATGSGDGPQPGGSPRRSWDLPSRRTNGPMG
jgi:hypothetical protein